ncbi:MAG: hypothetical protein R3338_15195, partial [Thermoanaerobaculia bacterium]|nr:hypothetical protein [Thermoanaerobaculia bacterium]
VPSTLPPSQYRMVLKTFTHSFPHVQLWQFLPAHERGPFNSILVGSLSPVTIDARAIDRRFARGREALASLVPYGLTSADALLPHFVADERVIREAVATASLNSHDHPRYEFYPPWKYASEQTEKTIANQDFILTLKRRAHPRFFSNVSADAPDPNKLRQTFEAEFLYLEAFQRFLAGMPAADAFRIFDGILEMAPWNDSLRARIYAQYRHVAASQPDPRMRMLFMGRAISLYD